MGTPFSKVITALSDFGGGGGGGAGAGLCAAFFGLRASGHESRSRFTDSKLTRAMRSWTVT